ncbi:SGNH/GDSL hydrolase family protein [Streptomyces sp. RG80]|uniref:SGNH/GDSL hydrolase family protein n=1 Tax=Streptomyces sp. RG80 TaxID=3157340 RepID=UPI00338D6764
MGLSARSGMAGTLALGVILVVLAVTMPGSGEGDGSPPPEGPYVALGDSYTSGPGIPEQTGRPAGCDRSDRNYPALVAAELGLEAAEFRDMSCTGAKTTDLDAPQSTDDGTNPAQLSALGTATRLVTLGIGGNDIGFSSMLTTCVTAGVLHNAVGDLTDTSGGAPCEQRYEDDETARKISTAGDRVSRALAEVKRRAPQADVYVVGYPAILPPAADAASCAGAIPLAAGDVAFLGETERQLNDALRQAARAVEATYVDTYTPSVDRDACSPAHTRWIEPLDPAGPVAAVHPNERGERGMAGAVLKALGG